MPTVLENMMLLQMFGLFPIAEVNLVVFFPVFKRGVY